MQQVNIDNMVFLFSPHAFIEESNETTYDGRDLSNPPEMQHAKPQEDPDLFWSTGKNSR